MSTPPLLVFAWGNPSRGDDALGPLFAERAAERLAAQVAAGAIEFLTDFQLQVEHALDLAGRARVVFVDASAVGPAPFSYAPVAAARDASITTHSVSPAALLEVAERVLGAVPPPAFLLAIRGERFGLGEPLSEAAAAHLAAAVDFFAADAMPRGGPPLSRAAPPGSS